MILSTHLFCLLNLSTTSQLCPPLLLAYTFDVLDLLRRTTNQILFAIYYALYTIHYALCTMYYSLCTMYCSIFTIHYSLFTIHYTLCTMHYTMHYVYVFIRIHMYLLFYTYSLFHVEIRRNPMILVLTRSSRRVE